MPQFQLTATNARDARREASQIEPTKEKSVRGYDKDGQCVYMSTVRETGNRANVATATRNRAPRASSFVAFVKD